MASGTMSWPSAEAIHCASLTAGQEFTGSVKDVVMSRWLPISALRCVSAVERRARGSGVGRVVEF